MSRYMIRKTKAVLEESEKCCPAWGYIYYYLLSLSLIYDSLQDS